MSERMKKGHSPNRDAAPPETDTYGQGNGLLLCLTKPGFGPNFTVALVPKCAERSGEFNALQPKLTARYETGFLWRLDHASCACNPAELTLHRNIQGNYNIVAIASTQKSAILLPRL